MCVCVCVYVRACIYMQNLKARHIIAVIKYFLSVHQVYQVDVGRKDFLGMGLRMGKSESYQNQP